MAKGYKVYEEGTYSARRKSSQFSSWYSSFQLTIGFQSFIRHSRSSATGEEIPIALFGVPSIIHSTSRSVLYSDRGLDWVKSTSYHNNGSPIP